MKAYEMLELAYYTDEPEGSQAQVDLTAEFTLAGKTTAVKGFYAGNGLYKIRFLPEAAGNCTYIVKGVVEDRGILRIEEADGAHHGPVRPDGTHLRYADGTPFYSFGTTVYALAHQSIELIDETMETLAASPFNKVRMCVFPKHYNYNHNNPRYYAFERNPQAMDKTYEAEEGSQVAGATEEIDTSVNDWDVNRPCFAFWEAFESRIRQLDDMGIQVDLILFHPYDRWGFASMPHADNLVYLDYLTRRLSAFPNIWWSLANEYDLCFAKTHEDWEEIERYVAENDPYHHMLSNHNCFIPWNFEHEHVTHVSWQTRQLTRVAEMMKRYSKPVLIDECCYEGTVPEPWGNISGEEMTARFWRVMTCGGYCTHGETFLPGTALANENTHTGESGVVWWASGGRLHGTSPARIAFLREIVESLPGPLDPMPEGLGAVALMSDAEIEAAAKTAPKAFSRYANIMLSMGAEERARLAALEYAYAGHVGEEAYLWYKDLQCAALHRMTLPASHTYRVTVIDTWNMTCETVLTGATGPVEVTLPGRPWIAVLAVAE